jgi:rRNA maturation RNase YbeY
MAASLTLKMKTTVRNLQRKHRLNLPAIRRLTGKLAALLEVASPDSVWEEVTLLLTDDEGITQTNRGFFGKDCPTDVISFRSEAIPGEEGCTGDLIVNVERAVQEGPYHGGIDEELALYIAHGFDHLSGADDNTPARRVAMRRTEMRQLKELAADIRNLILH